MYCRQCGFLLQDKKCPRCGQIGSGQSLTAQRVWVAFGLSFILIGVAVLAGAHWFVEKRRERLKTPAVTTGAPAVSRTETETPATPSLDLTKLKFDEMIKLLPSYALVRLKSDTGESRPDALKVIAEGSDQYLVMLGSRLVDSKKRERLLLVFKVEENQLSDVSK